VLTFHRYCRITSIYLYLKQIWRQRGYTALSTNARTLFLFYYGSKIYNQLIKNQSILISTNYIISCHHGSFRDRPIVHATLLLLMKKWNSWVVDKKYTQQFDLMLIDFINWSVYTAQENCTWRMVNLSVHPMFILHVYLSWNGDE
jgi:hypothetical protein